MAHLPLEQRYKIQTLREEGLSLKEIAEQVGKDNNRNTGFAGRFTQRLYKTLIINRRLWLSNNNIIIVFTSCHVGGRGVPRPYNAVFYTAL